MLYTHRASDGNPRARTPLAGTLGKLLGRAVIVKACLVIFCLPAGLSAPSVMGTLRGHVMDGQDAPVARAIVAVISAQGKVKLATSNPQGEYTIHDLDPGHYTIWATEGNLSLLDGPNLEISHGQVETINISLAGPSGPRTRRLPVLGRPPLQLAVLASAVNRAGSSAYS